MTELHWEGKYKDGKKVAPVRIALPFQTVETINESAADRKRHLESLFGNPNKPTEWRNRLIWGDKKYVLPSLLPEFAGKINLIYIDPPFDTGANFSFTATIADHPDTEEDEATSFVKEPSMIEQKAYRDTWGGGLDSYLQWFYETAVLLRDLLTEDGCIYVHLDWHVGHYAKAVVDEVFGYDNFRNEIIVKRPISKNLQSQFKTIDSLSTGHDVILWYSKNPKTRFKPIYVEYEATKPEGYWHHFWSNADRPNLRYELLGVTPKTGQWKYNQDRALKAAENYDHYIENHSHQTLVEYWEETGRSLEFIRLSKRGKVENWFPPTNEKLADTLWTDIKAYENVKLYATQKAEELLEKIITTGSSEGDLVFDCFCGSGTTAAVAEKTNRKWITCDLGRFSIHTTRKRLLEIQNVKPFVVQNLGKYERQQWMINELTLDGTLKSSSDVEKRAAIENQYRNFILDLYHAKPISGYMWLHGAKAGRLVHVGSVDAPVSNDDIKRMVQEFWKTVGKNSDQKSNGIDVLGWDFAFELNETASQFAAANKIDLKFKKIPREVLERKAVEQGDIKFFEMASLGLKVKTSKNQVSVTLDNFMIPPDDVPQEVQSKISHWSQWVDYWSIDWNFKEDTFHNEWQSYRTRQDAKIELVAANAYQKPGKYTILVKVIDILGNDTTKAVQVEIKG